MSAFTVIVSLAKTGQILTDIISDQRTPQNSVAKFIKDRNLTNQDVADTLVILGITGSIVLHLSAAKTIAVTQPTQAELTEAFALVKPATNWKDPINTTIKDPGADTVELISHAISHFTGSAADITPAGKGRIRIKAAGYYAAIGA